jgi:hypothetical protein
MCSSNIRILRTLQANTSWLGIFLLQLDFFHPGNGTLPVCVLPRDWSVAQVYIRSRTASSLDAHTLATLGSAGGWDGSGFAIGGQKMHLVILSYYLSLFLGMSKVRPAPQQGETVLSRRTVDGLTFRSMVL